jgi:DNA invertase Pin-like site-specific DNA recombinase
VKPRRSQSPTRAVLYTRVSTEKQERSGLGLEAQLTTCRDYAKRKGYQVIGEYSDPAISGRDNIDKRPGLQKVLAAASKRRDVVVIVYSLSRLSRRQSLTWKLLDGDGEYRLQVESATEPFDTSTPMGKAMLGMLAVWAQLEADMCSERTSDALAAKKARGARVGAKPLAELHPEVALRARELYSTGRYTYRTLADELNALGLPTALGGKWHATSVRRVLNQPLPKDDT